MRHDCDMIGNPKTDSRPGTLSRVGTLDMRYCLCVRSGAAALFLLAVLRDSPGTFFAGERGAVEVVSTRPLSPPKLAALIGAAVSPRRPPLFWSNDTGGISWIGTE